MGLVVEPTGIGQLVGRVHREAGVVEIVVGAPRDDPGAALCSGRFEPGRHHGAQARRAHVQPPLLVGAGNGRTEIVGVDGLSIRVTRAIGPCREVTQDLSAPGLESPDLLDARGEQVDHVHIHRLLREDVALQLPVPRIGGGRPTPGALSHGGLIGVGIVLDRVGRTAGQDENDREDPRKAGQDRHGAWARDPEWLERPHSTLFDGRRATVNHCKMGGLPSEAFQESPTCRG